MLHSPGLFCRCCLLAVAVVFLAASAVPAVEAPGPARLAADFEPGTFSWYWPISDFARLGNRVVFLQSDHEYFPALWVTDGTARGTMLLAVLCPPCSGGSLLGSTGSVAFYKVASGYPSEVWIWRTDGTPAGTFPVSPGLREPPDPGFLSAVADGRLYFTACTPEQGCEPWSSDGTVAGTAIVEETLPGPESRGILQLAASGGQAFLVAGTPGGGQALWLADGSGHGLRYLRETPKAAGLTAAGDAPEGNGRVFFIAQNVGLEVWTSDGTRAGTRPLTSFGPRDPFGYLPTFEILAGRAYFHADDGVHGRELWSLGRRATSLRRITDFSDPEGFAYNLVKAGGRIVFRGLQNYEWNVWSSRGDFRSAAPLTGCPGGCPLALSELVDAGGGRVMLYGSDPVGGGFWLTDGTGAGTRLVKRPDRERGLAQGAVAGGRFLFELIDEYETGELWISDGTAAGTFRVGYGGPGWSHYYGWRGPLQVEAAGDRLVFPAAEAEDTELALWSSNGSPKGLRRIKRTLTGKSSLPQRLAPFQDGLLVQDCSGDQGQLLFVRGTGAATTEITPLLAPRECFFASQPVNLGDAVVFLMSEREGTSLWRTDGTPGGTVALIEALPTKSPQALTRFGAQAAFWRAESLPVSLPDGPFQFRLWITDGTQAGTRKLLDLPPGVEAYELKGVSDRLYFADTEQRGDPYQWRPWVSDGTAEGTGPLTSLEGLNLNNLGGEGFVEMGGRAFFRMSQGDGPVEIWSTDGTPAGTGPAVRSAAGMVDPESLTPVGERLYFAARREGDPTGPFLPWISDGTTVGTMPLVPGGSPSLGGLSDFAPRDPLGFIELGGRVYFAAFDPDHGEELWATEGTPETTARVSDLQPGALGSYPRGLTSWNGRLWFRAVDPVRGMELWSSDGSAQGTRFVQDIAAGASWSTPVDLTPAGQDLYFSAHDGVHGRELWVLPAEALDPGP